jgi:hypothetical protein
VSPDFPQVDSDVQHVDGVDVAQLLREIGEASASQSAVELFRLCLGAQRVLAAVIGDRVTS